MVKYISTNTMGNIKIKILISIILLALLSLVILKFSKQTPQKQIILPENTVKQTKEQEKTPVFYTYTHPDYNFSFTYPEGLTIGTQDTDENGQVVLVQSKNTGTIGQIYISKFPQDKQLTAELLKQEFPNKKFLNGKKVLIGGTEAFSFESEEEGTGKTWEVVFVDNGYIYQAMSTINNRNIFESILTTWEF